MAQCMKYSLDKHEGMSSDPQHSCKAGRDIYHASVTPVLGRWEVGREESQETGRKMMFLFVFYLNSGFIRENLKLHYFPQLLSS